MGAHDVFPVHPPATEEDPILHLHRFLSGQFESRAGAGRIEAVLESVQEDGKPEFAGAMTGRYALDLEFVRENPGNATDFVLRRHYQMKSPGDGVESGIDFRRVGEDLLNARMGTTHHHRETR